MKKKVSISEISTMVEKANARARKGRIQRLKVLLASGNDGFTPFSGLAYEYYEEARLCWYMGAFVATIVMTQLAFEETLRSHYRVSGGVKGNLSSGKSVDHAGFADLINEALSNGKISKAEAEQLHKLRREIRNPYVHPKDSEQGNQDSKHDFFYQHAKIASQGLLNESTEKEAKWVIDLAIDLLPKISVRFFGGSKTNI